LGTGANIFDTVENMLDQGAGLQSGRPRFYKHRLVVSSDCHRLGWRRHEVVLRA
jgi:hypothetical protein